MSREKLQAPAAKGTRSLTKTVLLLYGRQEGSGKASPARTGRSRETTSTLLLSFPSKHQKQAVEGMRAAAHLLGVPDIQPRPLLRRA